MATNMSQFSNALFMRSSNGISPNQTTCGADSADAAAHCVVVKVFADIEDKLGIEATILTAHRAYESDSGCLRARADCRRFA